MFTLTLIRFNDEVFASKTFDCHTKAYKWADKQDSKYGAYLGRKYTDGDVKAKVASKNAIVLLSPK